MLGKVLKAAAFCDLGGLYSPLSVQHQDRVSGVCRNWGTDRISVETGGDAAPFWDIVALKCKESHDFSAWFCMTGHYEQWEAKMKTEVWKGNLDEEL